MSLLSGLLRFRSRSPGLVCQEVVELVTDYLEGALSPADRRRFEVHLAGCPHCTEYLAQIRETIRLAGRVEPADLTPQMRTDLTDLYRRWHAEG
jgi:predicted anti-sigma-YlaC factor YlaD